MNAMACSPPQPTARLQAAPMGGIKGSERHLIRRSLCRRGPQGLRGAGGGFHGPCLRVLTVESPLPCQRDTKRNCFQGNTRHTQAGLGRGDGTDHASERRRLPGQAAADQPPWGGPRLGLRHPGLLCHPGQGSSEHSAQMETWSPLPWGQGLATSSGQGSCQGSQRDRVGSPPGCWGLGRTAGPHLPPKALALGSQSRVPFASSSRVPQGLGPGPRLLLGPWTSPLVLSQRYSNDYKSRGSRPTQKDSSWEPPVSRG